MLLQRQGAQDFFWKAPMVQLDHDDTSIDIHHIFPRKWCDAQEIAPRTYNSIVNKTAISYKANRMIGGRAPSDYLALIQEHKNVQLSDVQMDPILESHLIPTQALRLDDFPGFYEARKAALLALVEKAMGKQAIQSTETVADDAMDEESDAEAAA